MGKPVFFSFHWERDVFRANVVRNSWVTKFEGDSFEDGGLREAVKRNDERAIKAAINRAVSQTDITVVLIGAETAQRPWVRYEIQRTFIEGNALLGIYVHQIPCMKTKRCDRRGANPFRYVDVDVDEGILFWEDWQKKNLWRDYQGSIPIYDWIGDDGYSNVEDWIDEARSNCGWS